MLSGLPSSNLDPLRQVVNAAVSLVADRSRYHMTEHMMELHWLHLEGTFISSLSVFDFKIIRTATTKLIIAAAQIILLLKNLLFSFDLSSFNLPSTLGHSGTTHTENCILHRTVNRSL